MIKVYDFKCTNGHLFEGFVEETYKPVKSTFDLSGVREEFCYLFVGHWIQGDLGHDRKNIGLLIR